MASRTKPLISAAALASAAAVAVATPALSPSLGAPTPIPLSTAAFELTTISDVFTIPPEVWTDILFGNTDWGGTLGPESFGPDWAAPQDAFLQPAFVNPWAFYCDNGCTQTGIPGVSYLFLDALINGNGNGFDDVENWPIGFVNYFAEPNSFRVVGAGSAATFFFENYGYSAATWYLLQSTIGQAIPEAQIPIAALFWGPQNVSIAYNFGLSAVAGLLQAVPLVGPFAGNSILAYLGDLAIDPENPSLGFYQYGLSGTLNYWIDIATGAVPFPTGTTTPAPEAASLAAAETVAEADTATVVSAEVAESTPVDAPAGEAPVEVAETTPAVEVAPVVEAPVVEAPVVESPAAEEAVVGEVVTEEIAEVDEIAAEVEAAADAVTEDAPADPDVADLDVADLDVADLDVADDAPAESPKSTVGDAADSESSKADSAGADSAGDSAGSSDSAGSDDSE